ncbi:hypothetical protein D4A92_23140 (plasmid) [Rhizobium rosettiformans]|uniref:Uncharacterized protein n=1 Tax=Rhizobium rosettiformans TaxID=1368430 RepID=A0ABX7F2H2_9HYPH|nr:hypothetical protein [Rhizobium rosettiformans]QRF54409.1 hypothetical protein D4A92_23140 [Rhizobium rosettiformans]
MTDTHTNDVVANALAEVAKLRVWREKVEAERRKTFGAMGTRQSVYVLARQKPAPTETKSQ